MNYNNYNNNNKISDDFYKINCIDENCITQYYYVNNEKLYDFTNTPLKYNCKVQIQPDELNYNGNYCSDNDLKLFNKNTGNGSSSELDLFYEPLMNSKYNRCQLTQPNKELIFNNNTKEKGIFIFKNK
jgi:hypothetical protein